MTSKTVVRRKIYIIVAIVFIGVIGVGVYQFFIYKPSTKKTFEQLKRECIEDVKAHPEVIYKRAPCTDDLIRNEYLEQ
jgi:hypothetical protein